MFGITAHMVVKNEDQFIWYAISSVLPYVDKLLIYDTGSTDQTAELIKLFKNRKIIFEKMTDINASELVNLRQKQIEATTTDWIWIVDGDEVYPQKTAERVVKAVKENKTKAGIIVRRYDLLGDIYHFQDESVGSYDQFGNKGHYVLRLINKREILCLHVKGVYPHEYYADKNGESIKRLGRDKFVFIEQRVFHAMYLRRSSIGAKLPDTLHRQKWKIELGKQIPRNDLPEVFYRDKPKNVPDINYQRSLSYFLLACLITPIKMIKRRIIKPVL